MSTATARSCRRRPLGGALRRAASGHETRTASASPPVILGNGTPLFVSGVPHRPLRLLEARPLTSGAVILRYAPDRDLGMPR